MKEFVYLTSGGAFLRLDTGDMCRPVYLRYTEAAALAEQIEALLPQMQQPAKPEKNP